MQTGKIQLRSWNVLLAAALLLHQQAARPALARDARDPDDPGLGAADPLGLSSRQREGLYRLSRGRVDLRGEAWRRDGGGGPVPSWGPTDRPGSAALVGGEGDDGRKVDPALVGQWWLEALNVRPAWEVATGRGVTLADCDTGFYTGERDLAANLRVDLRRDFSDPHHPFNVGDGAYVFHGTAVAAIIAGVRDGRGTQGLAYEAKLIPLQNYNYDRRLDVLDKEEATARCILHAIQIPEVSVLVVQNQTATGSSETYAGTRDAIRLAVASGVSVVSAAGNASVELTAERDDDTGSIIVGALRQDQRIANYSNFGSRITVAAFGEGLHTLHGPGGRMDFFGGTTGAAAQVAGAVALMRSANGDLTPDQVRRILVATRRTIPGNQKVGGLLDVQAAVMAARLTKGDLARRDEQWVFRSRLIDTLRKP